MGRLLGAILLLACAMSPSELLASEGTAKAASRVPGVPAHLKAAVESPSRPEADRARDADRKPAEVLAFFGIEPGMKVAEMMAGSGWYAEILAEAIGPEGRLYVHNSPFVLQRFAEKPLTERLARMKAVHVTRLDGDPGDPGLPTGLDVVLLIRFYHDFFWQGVDRAAFNKAVFAALKPGGVFGVVDHHAEAGSGDRDAKEMDGLHRVDAALVRKEIEAAGFVLDAESDLLRHPEDTRDWFIFKDEGKLRDKTDRFIFRFRKPAD